MSSHRRSGIRWDKLRTRSLLLARAIVVLFLELAVRLQPLIQVVVHVANVIATFDVDLTRSLMDFCEGWSVLACFFRHTRPNACWHVLSFRGQIRCFHSLVVLYKRFLLLRLAVVSVLPDPFRELIA